MVSPFVRVLPLVRHHRSRSDLFGLFKTSPMPTQPPTDDEDRASSTPRKQRRSKTRFIPARDDSSPSTIKGVNKPSTATATSSFAPTAPSRDRDDNESKTDQEAYDEDPYNVATRLLGLLLQRREEEEELSFDSFLQRLTPSYWILRKQRAKRIEALIEQIQDMGDVRKNQRGVDWGALFGSNKKNQRKRQVHTYDPAECLIGGGFFCTLYFYTPNNSDAPDPLWEQLSFKRDNVKGQQYYERNDFQEAVINYSEVWGPDLYITAEGTFRPIDFPTNNEPDARGGFALSFPSFGSNLNREKQQQEQQQQQQKQQSQSNRLVPDSRRQRICPDIFQVDATSGSLHCDALGGLSVPLPIVGSSNLVVVYADARLRILLSPKSSETVVGNWEESGLMVVQVRSDLALSSNGLQERWNRRRNHSNDKSVGRNTGHDNMSLDFR